MTVSDPLERRIAEPGELVRSIFRVADQCGRIVRCIFLVVSGVIGLAACASTEGVSARVELVDRPPLNTEAQAELGDTIVEKGRFTTLDGLALHNMLVWGDGVLLKKYTISPGTLRARQQDASFVYYFSDRMTVYDAMLGTAPLTGGLCVKKADKSYIRLFAVPGICRFTPKPLPSVDEVRVTDVDEPGFRQELIYNGRSVDMVKFLYREFSGDSVRPAFTQDIQYDLKDSSTIGFKGVRIEILNATNTKLNYRVLASFPPPVN
jgi:hypothetical protein